LLDDNNLTGGIPTEFGGINDLMKINIGGNGVNGTFPTEVGRLSNLKDLDFSRNNLNSSIPNELFGLQLERVRLNSNQIYGSISSNFGSMASLKVLRLGKKSPFLTFQIISTQEKLIKTFLKLLKSRGERYIRINPLSTRKC